MERVRADVRREALASLGAGLAYFAVVFVAGFVLGTLRVLAVAPRLGEVAAVLAELPVMLAVSWTVCGWLLGRVALSGGWGYRLAMGGVALVLLLGAELGLSVLAFGRTIAEHLASYRSPAGALGLAGQVAFALFPLLRRPGGRAAPPAASPHDCSAGNRRHVRSSQDDPP